VALPETIYETEARLGLTRIIHKTKILIKETGF